MDLIRQDLIAMGTQVSVSIATVDARREEAQEAIAALADMLSVFGRDAWSWGEGALAQLNRRLRAGAAIRIPPALQPLFERAWAIHRASGGRYEPRIAALVELWGFDEPEHLRSAPPPDAAIETCLAALRAAPAYDGGAHYGPAPGVAWDFGGIGKGWIVDIGLDFLARCGFGDVLVNAGGNVAVRGTCGERAWRVGIRDPRSPDAELPMLLATLEPGNESVITHGDDQRWFEHRGIRYAHLLDPVTGWPARGLRSVTVVHADGTRADAEGAALFVAGADWPALARALGHDQVLAVDADGALQLTRRLAARLKLLGDTPTIVVD